MNLHHQQTIRLTDHPVVATERPLGHPFKPHPGAALKVPRHGETRHTCKTYWRTRPGKQDRSTDRVGAPRHAGHDKYGQAEYNRPSSSELRRDIAQYRGAAHPLCFIDEVMDHQIPEGFQTRKHRII